MTNFTQAAIFLGSQSAIAAIAAAFRDTYLPSA